MFAGVLYVAFGILAFVLAGVFDRERTRKRRWPTVMGRILERGVGPHMGAGFGPGIHAPLVRYSYVVAGTEYVAEGCYDVGRVGDFPSKIQKLVDRLPDPIAVHYDPGKPGEAYILRTSRAYYWIMIGAGVFATLLGAGQILVATTN